MENKTPTLEELYKIVSVLGYPRGLKSNSKLYVGGGMATFSYPEDSTWFLTVVIPSDNLINGVEVNTTYFKATPAVHRLNKFCQTPKTIDEVLKFLGV